MSETTLEAPKLKRLRLLDHYDTADAVAARIAKAFAASGFEVDDASARWLHRFQDVRLRDLAMLSDAAIVGMLRPYFEEVQDDE